jgi:hypothetical protein
MGTFDIRQDAPGLLRSESLNTSIKFDRTGPTTGRISWNIPTPAAGCTADTQAYCGMLVTIDTTPASSTKLPINNTVYSSDPTADTNLFAGDKIGTAMVIGAFYQDRDTTFFDVTGLKQNSPYYVSGFPTDCEFRYFREGIHAYSLEMKAEAGNTTSDTTGSQVVEINGSGTPSGVQPTDVTGLVTGIDYEFTIQLGVIPNPQGPTTHLQCLPTTKTYTITIPGENAGTYSLLVEEINKQLALLDHPPVGPQPPNTNAYFYNTTAKKLFLWDGYQHIEQEHIRSATAPNIVASGTYWFNPDTSVLQLFSTVWTPVTYITHDADPTTPACGTVWFNGTQGYTWSGTAWCPQTTYVQIDNPSMNLAAVCGAYWFDTVNSTLSAWNDALDLWTVTTAVQYHIAPNALPDGTYWFNESTSVLNARTGSVWTAQTNVSISENAPTTPAPGKFWYNPTTMELYQRNQANTAWVQLDVLVFPSDPTVVDACEAWWNTDTDVLSVWDTVNSTWNVVTSFFQQDTDPTDPPTINNGDIWFDPSTQTLSVWQDVCFTNSQFINWPTDPTMGLPVGTPWAQPSTGVIRVWNGTGWDVITPIVSTDDPTALPAGTYWFGTSTSTLSQWNGVAWISLLYSTYPLTPTKDSYWFDLSTNTLMVWDGTTWVVATTRATATLNCANNLEFTDNNPGSLSLVQLTDVSLFSSLVHSTTILSPTPGTDGVSQESSYLELGIGTDGSMDERLKLMNEIRYELGYPVVDVELTNEQLDFAITKALEEIRSKTSVAYKRGFFFMHVNAETQRYLLTNKVQGMDKIVTVLGIYRLTSSFLSSAHGAGVYGQIVMQHLYNMGTFDLLSYHLMSEYTELMEILFAGRITFTWNEQKRDLWIHHRFPFHERMVLIEAATERTEQDIIADRWCRPWIRKFASAQARMMLAETRGKYSTLPGAGGAVTLNASDLRQKATEDIQACMDEIDNYQVDRPEEYGLGAQMVLG